MTMEFVWAQSPFGPTIPPIHHHKQKPKDHLSCAGNQLCAQDSAGNKGRLVGG